MKTHKLIPQSVNEYIAMFPTDIQENMNGLRATIKNAAPESEEAINYQRPAYKYHGMLVYFAAHNTHIGFYPTPSGIAAFKKELSINL